MIQRTYVIAAMHHIAKTWARQAGHAECVTFTKASSLKGLPPHTPLIVIDSAVRFEDIRAMEAALTRFTDVKRIAA